MHRGFVNFGSLAIRQLPVHRNLGMEIVYVSEGVLHWTVEDRSETVRPGFVFFTLPWQAHGSLSEFEPGNRTHFVQFFLDRIHRDPVASFGFHPWLGFPAARARQLSRTFTTAQRHAWPASPDLVAFLLALINRLEQGEGPLFVRSLFAAALLELEGIVSGRRPAAEQANPVERRVWEFIDRLNDCCDQPWTLDSMARACHMGRTLFSRTVHRLTGQPPMAFLYRLRTNRAARLLRETDMGVTEIAFASGFSSGQLLARTFRKFTRKSPVEHRRKRGGMPVPIDLSLAEERRFREAIRKGEWVQDWG